MRSRTSRVRTPSSSLRRKQPQPRACHLIGQDKPLIWSHYLTVVAHQSSIFTLAVCLLIVVLELHETGGFAVVLFCVHFIRLIFMVIPLMIVVVLFIVVGARALLIFSSQRDRRHCQRGYQR